MRAREKITVFWLEPSLESWTLKGERRLCSEAKNKHFWNRRGEKKRKSYFWQWRSKGEWLSEHFQGLGRLHCKSPKKEKKSISSVGTNWKGQDLQQRTAVLSTVLELRLYTVLIVSRSHGWLCLTVTSLLSSVPSFIGLLQHQRSNDTLFIRLFLMVCFIKMKKSEPVCDFFPADVTCRGDRRQQGGHKRRKTVSFLAADPPPISSLLSDRTLRHGWHRSRSRAPRSADMSHAAHSDLTTWSSLPSPAHPGTQWPATWAQVTAEKSHLTSFIQRGDCPPPHPHPLNIHSE